jgi:HAD superfamily hydrolase (TIGR01549 family)
VKGQISALTFDFFQTLAHHGTGRGRGLEVVDYLQGHGLTHSPWRHAVLYDVFEPHLERYPLHGSDADRRRYRVELADRLFGCLGVTAPDGAAHEHADALWTLLGPSSLSVYPETRAVLGELSRAGFAMAVVSNWHHGLAHFAHEMGIGSFFDHVVVSAEVDSFKPDGVIFAEAQRLLGVEPSRILHIGDQLVDDVQGGRSAGLQVLLVDREGQAGDPDVPTVRDLTGVLGVLGLG